MASKRSFVFSSSSPPEWPVYYPIDDAECLDDYCEGGYHPVEIDDVLYERYRIVNKLGFGGWSTVWLAHDSIKERYVALKVGIARPIPNEIKVLRALEMAGGYHDKIPRLLDEFRVNGPNGSHPCYVTEPAMCSVRYLYYLDAFPLDVARAMAYELVQLVSFVHSRGFVHGEQFREEFGEPIKEPVERFDGKPPPIGVPRTLVLPVSFGGKPARKFTLSDVGLLLGDFGEAFAPASSEPRLGADCHIPAGSLPPDAHLQPDVPLSFSSDIWSLALAIWYIFAGIPLFGSCFDCPDDVMDQMIDNLGPLPNGWWEKWEKRTEYYNDDGTKKGRYVDSGLDKRFEKAQDLRRKRNIGEAGPEETVVFFDLMRRMLKYEPEERLTINEVLQSEWMVKWALPEHQRSLEARGEL
ncbi:hypothetical protein CP532_6626 [Ophiocordyceps camponoti-leonardi (nom. inval.)]|nr:hypothetical protein CP532_6626 [Ophiocordyceps camponoti-leonardi (nom. inval.)]